MALLSEADIEEPMLVTIGQADAVANPWVSIGRTYKWL